MMCPYTVDVVEVTQTKYEYNDEGYTSFAETVQKTARTEHECKQAECAAWNGQRCTYYEMR